VHEMGRIAWARKAWRAGHYSAAVAEHVEGRGKQGPVGDVPARGGHGS